MFAGYSGEFTTKHTNVSFHHRVTSQKNPIFLFVYFLFIFIYFYSFFFLLRFFNVAAPGATPSLWSMMGYDGMVIRFEGPDDMRAQW